MRREDAQIYVWGCAGDHRGVVRIFVQGGCQRFGDADDDYLGDAYGDTRGNRIG
jgi:hypothetical protein